MQEITLYVILNFSPCFVARKLKKIGQQKNPDEDHPPQEPAEVMPNISPKTGLSFNSQVVFLNILESIEPEVAYAGHDYGQPDSAATLLTSLNELGEKQLVKVVKWAKGLPGKTLWNLWHGAVNQLTCNILSKRRIG